MTKLHHDEKYPSSTYQLPDGQNSPMLEEEVSQNLKKLNNESIQQHNLDNISSDYAVFRQNLEYLTEIEQANLEDMDRHFLKGYLAYFSRLYKTGKIGEDDYISLINQAAESYVDSLIQSKIKKYLKKAELYIEKASILNLF